MKKIKMNRANSFIDLDISPTNLNSEIEENMVNYHLLFVHCKENFFKLYQALNMLKEANAQKATFINND